MKTKTAEMMNIDQDRDDTVQALASARSVIRALERGTSMKEDEDDQDKTRP